MASLWIALGAASVLAWIVLVFFRGQFWRVQLPKVDLGSASAARVAVVIPARNEEESVGAAVRSLLGQDFAGELRIFLTDDGSTDATAERAREAAAAIGEAEALTIIQGETLPPGWTGKLWAVRQGIERAREFNTDFFLLTDADIEHSPQNLQSLIAIAQGGNFDLTSYMVKLRCETFAEKLLIPAFVFFFFKLYPPRWISEESKKTAGAAGGCMLIRPEALGRAGGIEGIRSELIDDCALARAVKSSGGKVWLGPTQTARSLRRYETFGEIGKMISRAAFNQLQHSLMWLLAAMVGMALVYLIPLTVLFSGVAVAVALGICALVLMLASYLPTIRLYGLSPLWALALPFASIFYMGATVHSGIQYWRGRGGEWKGRAQDVRIGIGD